VAALHVYATPINRAGQYTTLADVTVGPPAAHNERPCSEVRGTR